MGLMAEHRGVAWKHFANVKAAEKCFHVPATSSEAPSTSDGVAGTWKRLSASSTLAMWALGLWGGGVVVIVAYGVHRWVHCVTRSIARVS